MANGTATIRNNETLGIYELTFVGFYSDLVGLQLFGNSSDGFRAALRFCRERGFRIVECAV